MLRRFFLVIFITLLVGTSCTKQVTIIPPPAKQALQHRKLPAFNQVTVEGNVNVSLHTGYARPKLILHGDPTDLLQVKTVVTGSTLLIAVGKGYPRCGPITAEIRGRYLNGFNYRGAGTITGNNLRSGLMDLSIENPGRTTLGGKIFLRKLTVSGGGYTQISGVTSQNLQLSIQDNSKVQLSGIVNITRLNLDSNAWLGMNWIKSNALIVRAKGHSVVQLAGIVGKLDVELCEQAQFKGRYLRAGRAFVKTHDKAVAEISAVRRQHTLATDASDIYFYNIPSMKTDFMAYNGAVLDMRDWDLYAMQEYDRYNK
ncbi:GIN domain-containing protein [Legionella jamestowniensis]|uniref:Putative auto-transporter adhesin head GIN domain-containing protein n=1 Tax=Legionella jamestowniensis TaxID=455 RepID=A0A0W0UIB0_9GAMM|nr:DUF2807 domain-containing protein [Legionella jamestowniensis]KTD07578.1 hypothetical protein Ljam_1773 [Legionella jamestowniensis]OCH97655.1 hypothetical protein A8135_02115 [Legionella jamestowniensis]SFM01966.1 hypothetical protein SAMN02746073_3103 [Legionella jamestowniensis DSM 19215]